MYLHAVATYPTIEHMWIPNVGCCGEAPCTVMVGTTGEKPVQNKSAPYSLRVSTRGSDNDCAQSPPPSAGGKGKGAPARR